MEVESSNDSLADAVWGAVNNTEEASGYPPGRKPVGLKPPNPMGLYDVFGNVAEWVRDGWTDTYSSTYVDSPNPGTDDYRISRGGYYDGSSFLDMRSKFVRNTQWDKMGFRLCFVGE